MSRPRARAAFLLGVLSSVLVATGCGRERTEEPEHRAAPAPTVTAAPTAPSSAQATAALPGSEKWNGAQIAWQTWEGGLRLAQAQKKPICLVLFTTWCPHCKNFSKVFFDPRVAERAGDFVMVRVDADAQPEVASKYAPDGGYIPRTFFLSPDGTLEASVHAPRPRYQYFYDEQDPAGLLAGMDQALRKLRG